MTGSRIERSAYIVALCVAIVSFGNTLIATRMFPATYSDAFITTIVALLGAALVAGVLEIASRRAPRFGVWGFIGVSALIVSVHHLAYRSSPEVDYPPLFHAVSMGFLLTAFVGPRAITALAFILFVPWSVALRTESAGLAQAVLEGVLWANFFPMVYVGSRLVGRATIDAEARATVLATARNDELRSVQRAFEQQRWDGLIHDKILGCLRLCFRETAGANVPDEARELAAQSAGILAEIHPDTEEKTLHEQIAEICRRLGLTPTIHVQEDDPNPMVAAALLSATGSALSNIALHAGTPHVSVQGRFSAQQCDVLVADVGVGFEPSQVDPRRAGLSHGIVQRMHSVGGRAVVTSAPGRGTAIHLSWQHISPKATVLAWRQRIFRHMVIFGTVMLLAQVAIGWLYLPSLELAWLAITGMILYPVIAWSLVLLPMGRRWFAVTALVVVLPYCLAWTAPPRTTDTAATWFIGASQAAIALMSFRYRAWLGPAVVGLQFVGLLLIDLIRGDIPWIVLITSFLSLALTAVAVAGARLALDSETRRILADSDEQTAMMASVIAAEERRSESQRRTAALADSIGPVLKLLAKLGTILTPELQRTCRDAEATLRDQLVAAPVLDDELVAAIAAARAVGASVEISAVGDAEDGLDQFREVAGLVLHDSRPGEHIRIRWRPNATDRRLGSIAIVGDRPTLDWLRIDLPANAGVAIASSSDESSVLLDLVQQPASTPDAGRRPN